MTRRSPKLRSTVTFLTAAVLVSLGLTACIPQQMYNKNKAAIDGANAQLKADQQNAYPKPPAVREESKAYVDTTPLPINHTPSWMKQDVTMRGTNLPLSFYVSQALANTDVINEYDNTVDRSKTLSLDFSGTTKEALDNLAATSGYYYFYDKDNNTVSWSEFETKVFDISFMPGDSEYQLGQDSSALTLSGGSSTGTSSGGSGGSAGLDFSKDNQFSKLTGTMSVWKDLATTLKTLLSKDGTATVSQSTTTITVHDRPGNVDAISNYLAIMNKELSKQVRIHVQILEVQLNSHYSYGIDWNVVRQVGKETLNLSSAGAANVAANNGTLTPVAFAWSSTNPASLWNGSNSIVQDLEAQGAVSVITQPTVTTLNNQVATISIQDQTNYVNSTTSTLSGSGSDFAQGGVNTSTITTGINLYLLPKVQNQQVFLQISSVLSALTGLETLNTSTGLPTDDQSQTPSAEGIVPSTEVNNPTSNPATSTSTSTSSSSSSTSQPITPQIVQLPTVSLRSFNQRSVIPNGATLILAGLISNTTQAQQNKIMDLAPLGGTGTAKNNIELVMLITPVILADNENDLGTNGYQDETPGGMG